MAEFRGVLPDGRLGSAAVAHVKEIAGAAGSGMPDGAVPIFQTLAEAEAWEAKNPGMTALTLEATEPDTTPPNPGTLKVAADAEFADLTVSGAWDDRKVSGYAFTSNAAASPVVWSAWQPEPVYRIDNLAPSTEYLFAHKVRDVGLNESVGGAVKAMTLAGPFTRIFDDFENGSGVISNRVAPVGGFTWGSGTMADFIAGGASSLTLTAGKLTAGGGVFTLPTNRAMIFFDYAPNDASSTFRIRVAIGTDGTTDNRLTGYISTDPSLLQFEVYTGASTTRLATPASPPDFRITAGGRVGFGFDGTNVIVERNGTRATAPLPSGMTIPGGYRYGLLIQSGDGWVDNVEVLPL